MERWPAGGSFFLGGILAGSAPGRKPQAQRTHNDSLDVSGGDKAHKSFVFQSRARQRREGTRVGFFRAQEQEQVYPN